MGTLSINDEFKDDFQIHGLQWSVKGAEGMMVTNYDYTSLTACSVPTFDSRCWSKQI